MISTGIFNGNLGISPTLFNNHALKPLGVHPLTFHFAVSSTKFRNNSLKRSRRNSLHHCRYVPQAAKFLWDFIPSESQNDLTGEIPEFRSIADFTRFRNNGDDGEELQTAVVSYSKRFPWSLLQPGHQVDLVAAVHIADKEYFAALQKELASYDRVLYEMVADKDPLQTNKNPRMRWMPPKRLPGFRARNFSIIGIIQRLMAQILTLDFQLECLDYRRSNWYHADLDYQTFKLLQFERGENFFTFARDVTVLSKKAITRSVFVPEDPDPWRSKLLWASRVLPMPLVGLFLIESVCARSDSPLGESPEMKALFRLDLAAALKVFLAKQITSELTDGTTELMEKSVIIGERNRVAMEELQGAMRDGCKKIAILYGGGHMPDMDRRLRKDFGLVPTGISWRTAWSIKNWKSNDQREFSASSNNIVASSGWQLNRYQTLALLLFSLVLAVDLWFWELFFSSIKLWADQCYMAAVQFLEHI
eukprot:Gb_29130 [translate_table: standard]